jgi:hypothetical protein
MSVTTQSCSRALLFVSVCAALGASGCQKDEAPPPLPTPPATASAAVVPLDIAPEDEPEEEKPKMGGVGKPAEDGLQKCCSALAQNAKNAPPPTDSYMNAAAGICVGAVATGKAKFSVIGAMKAALKGAGMPAECQ